MANLKELRNRIDTVKSTQKITSAMKMVAASRLRRSQQLLSKSSVYYNNILVIATRIMKTLQRVAKETEQETVLPKELTGTGKEDKYLLVVFTSDRGLCGGYNINVAKEALRRIAELKDKDVKVLCIGRKAKDILKRAHGDIIIDTFEGVASKGVRYDEAMDICSFINKFMSENEIDVGEYIYSKFRTVMSRDIINEQFYPMTIAPVIEEKVYLTEESFNGAYYEYEPDMDTTFDLVLEQLKKTVFYQVLINSQASEQGARMTSMDSATRNADDMIAKLRLKYNRIRQSAITTELTEIISGAEAI